MFFLFFLYTSPSGLVFYWTLNNLFSLVKTIFYKLKHPREVLAVLFAMRLAGQSELVSAIGALGSLIPYYIGLFCFKAKLRQKIVFGIQTAETASPPQASSVGKKQNENEITI